MAVPAADFPDLLLAVRARSLPPYHTVALIRLHACRQEIRGLVSKAEAMVKPCLPAKTWYGALSVFANVGEACPPQTRMRWIMSLAAI